MHAFERWVYRSVVLGGRRIEELSGIKEEIGIFFSVKGNLSVQGQSCIIQ